jgi:hypothetical protein
MTDFEPRRREFLKLSAAAGSALVAGAGSRPVNAHGRADAIVRYAVHPTIGIARVGNSEHEFYLAPELPGEIPRSARRLQGRNRRD